MPRLFGAKKQQHGNDQGHRGASASKKRFHLFRRGPTGETAAEAPPTKASSRKQISPPPTKKRGYRISVYETRLECSNSSTSSSTDGSDEQNRVIRRGTMERTQSLSLARPPIQFSRPVQEDTMKANNDPPPTSLSTHHANGILKPTLGPQKSRQDELADSFDLELARNATSLTDNLSTTSSDAQPPNETPNTPAMPKRGVSFSKDIPDNKPLPRHSGKARVYGRSAREKRKLRRHGDFSISHEIEDLCYDVTYFFRCLAEEQKSPKKRTSDRFTPTIPDDDQTDSTFDPSPSLASSSLVQSEASI